MQRHLAVVCLLWTTVALGAGSKVAATLAKEAERLMGAGLFAEATKNLEEAVKLDPSPKYLFSLGAAYEQTGQLQLASDAYHKVASRPETDADLRKRAGSAVERLRGLSDQSRPSEAKRLEGKAGLLSPSAQRTTSLVLGAIALGAVTTGIVFGFLSNSAKRAFRSAETVEAKRGRRSETTAQALVADIAFLGGLACAVTALFLFPQSSQVQMAVVAIPAGAFGSLTVSF